MLESTRELLCFGTWGGRPSGGLLRPTIVRLWEHLPELFPESSGGGGLQSADFALLKVFASWSRSMALTSVLVADLRQVNLPWKKVSQQVNLIAQKWEPRDFLPPYIESVASYFNAGLVKIPGHKAPVGIKAARPPQKTVATIGRNNNGKNAAVNKS
jgi:hypothetical protein